MWGEHKRERSSLNSSQCTSNSRCARGRRRWTREYTYYIRSWIESPSMYSYTNNIPLFFLLTPTFLTFTTLLVSHFLISLFLQYSASQKSISGKISQIIIIEWVSGSESMCLWSRVIMSSSIYWHCNMSLKYYLCGFVLVCVVSQGSWCLGGCVLVDARPLNQLLTNLALVWTPFFCHDGNHPSLVKVNLPGGWPILLFVRVCDCMPVWMRANLSESAGTITHGRNQSNKKNPKSPNGKLQRAISLTSY